MVYLKKRILDIGAASIKSDMSQLNKDTIIAKTNIVNGQEIGLFAVTNGFGTNEIFAKQVSVFAIDMLSFWWRKYFLEMLYDNYSTAEITEHLDKTIELINAHIIKNSARAGVSLSLVIIMGDIYIIRHIGNCRIYLANKKLYKLTRDHTTVKNSDAQGGMIPKTNKNILTNLLGMKSNVDIYKKMDRIVSEDIFLLCTDGFYNVATPPNILTAALDNNIYTMQDKTNAIIQTIPIHAVVDDFSLIMAQQILD